MDEKEAEKAALSEFLFYCTLFVMWLINPHPATHGTMLFFLCNEKSPRSFFNIKIGVVYGTFISAANVSVLTFLMLYVVQEEIHDSDWFGCCYWSESI